MPQVIEQSLFLFWPGMGKDVDAFVTACKVCRESKDPLGMMASREPLKPLATPSEPNLRVHADLFSPGAVSAAGHKYVLVITTDAFSKHAELVTGLRTKKQVQ